MTDQEARKELERMVKEVYPLIASDYIDKETMLRAAEEINTEYDERAKLENPVTKYLYWDDVEAFKTMEIAEALDLTTEEIRSRYLADTLPLARAIMRKDSFMVCCPVSEEISDEYLDKLLCMSWKSELIIRVVYYHKQKWNEERKNISHKGVTNGKSDC